MVVVFFVCVWPGPWVDLTDSFSGSWTTNQATDFLPRDIAHQIALSYAGDEHSLQQVSPINVDMAGKCLCISCFGMMVLVVCFDAFFVFPGFQRYGSIGTILTLFFSFLCCVTFCVTL